MLGFINIMFFIETVSGSFYVEIMSAYILYFTKWVHSADSIFILFYIKICKKFSSTPLPFSSAIDLLTIFSV
ncbi:hypothetical protein L6452_39558 [Arctium lappa]|uniref:Uncharacterized protein n=1 Tax=Arctium lappa TaxID=4217 RepID=A0ACB8XSV1_ARCLA|nr:hypothetical protein L6452_39558 [Arctium lappa]